ncbi:hypothetical protein Tco_1318311 [Tanacetum coccineum]
MESDSLSIRWTMGMYYELYSALQKLKLGSHLQTFLSLKGQHNFRSNETLIDIKCSNGGLDASCDVLLFENDQWQMVISTFQVRSRLHKQQYFERLNGLSLCPSVLWMVSMSCDPLLEVQILQSLLKDRSPLLCCEECRSGLSDVGTITNCVLLESLRKLWLPCHWCSTGTKSICNPLVESEESKSQKYFGKGLKIDTSKSLIFDCLQTSFAVVLQKIELYSMQSETTFSGGGDDEGSAAANSVMPALEDGDRGLEGTGSSVGTVEGSDGQQDPPQGPPYPLPDLVRLLLVLIVLGSVIQLPLVLSLAFRKSADLFIHTFLKLHYWTLTLEVFQTSTLITGVSSLIPSNSRIPTLLGHVVNLLAIPFPFIVHCPMWLPSHFLCCIPCYLHSYVVRSGLIDYGPLLVFVS